MPSYLTGALALALVAISFSSSAAAVSCAVCGPSIFFEGLTRTLTSTRQDSGNAAQCNYDTPPIAGIAPACVYPNVNGQLTVTNAGSACPLSVPVVQEAACPNFD
ncbi:hypothetical protein B0H16DRAFT_1464862 [Mycena metata]|uniref:Uncharacterized protein n=1 Tax=Mycena metata TaxID=1033252 RepID=A0AAD7IDI3_9AGAR|nr:hypothetical protein B0H16DRAFT_1464862 [Mycena metata]